MPVSILILDDDKDICELFQTGFDQEGFLVATATSVGEARQLLQKRYFDAVLDDVFLDNEDGLIAMQELIKLSPTTRVFSFTSHESIPLAVKAMEFGAAGFFAKTLGFKKIVELVKSKLITVRN